jgi:putative transposase
MIIRIEDAEPFCRVFFGWQTATSDTAGGIGLMTPEAVHYGRAREILEQRRRVLEAPLPMHSRGLGRGVPKPPTLPTAA